MYMLDFKYLNNAVKERKKSPRSYKILQFATVREKLRKENCQLTRICVWFCRLLDDKRGGGRKFSDIKIYENMQSA